MQLTTPRLLIDGLRSEDSAALFHNRADPDVRRYQSRWPASIDDALGFIETCLAVAPNTPGTWFQRAIRLTDTGDLIGDLGLHFIAEAESTIELGITLLLRYQQRGYAKEALNAVLGFVFDDLEKHRIYASVDPRNHASLKLLEGVGIRKEAHFQKSLRLHGEWADDVIYAMLAREWSLRRPAERHRG